MDNKNLGSKIRFHRKALGLTQTELAEKLFVTPQNMSKWETGLSNPDVWNLKKLAEVLNVSCDYLLGKGIEDDTVNVYLAVDGGATKTEFLLFTDTGKILKHNVLPGSNPNSCGIERVKEVLKAGIDEMMSETANIQGVFLGMSGSSDKKNKNLILEFLKSSYYDTKFDLQSDLYNVVYTKMPSDTYVSVICGTGSSLGVKAKDGIHRVGGFGYLFDETFCGYTLGKEAILATLRYENGIGEETLITKSVQNKMGASAMDEFVTIYGSGKDYIASFAKIVFDAYDKGDKIAEEIIEKSIFELSKLINHSIDRFGTEKNVVLSGGLTKRADVAIPLLKKYCPDIDISITDVSQIYGAVLCCLDTFGDLNEEFKQNMKQEYKAYFKEELL